MHKKTIYLIASAIFILLVIIGFSVWNLDWIKKNSEILKTSEELSDIEMITYRNIKYGYEFKHPIGTEVSGSNLTEASPVIIYDENFGDGRPYIQIEVVTDSWLSENYPNLNINIGANLKSYMSGNKEVVEMENLNDGLYRLLAAKNKGGSDVILLRQSKKTDFLDNIFKTFVLTDGDGSGSGLSQISKQFSYPYPISWKQNGIDFFLTGVSFGKTLAPEKLKKASGDYYELGEEVNALILIFKIMNTQNKYECANLNIRRVVNEEGDMVVPNTDQFHLPGSGGCMMENNTFYSNQKVIFVVPEDEKSFTITSGGTSNILFTINVLEADGIVRQQSDLQLEKNTNEEGLRRIDPYNADVLSCRDGGGKEYNTTGQYSVSQNWFIYGGCPKYKYYKVVPGKQIIMDVKTDISSCSECVCNHPSFSLYEYRGTSFVKTKDFNLADIGGVAEKEYYTPASDKIKIEANGCFYLDVFQEGETGTRISVISPNGGNQLKLGETYKIMWSSSGEMKDNLNIEIVNKEEVEGTAGAIGWHIAYSVPAQTGIYSWKIDGLPMGSDYSFYKLHIWSNENVHIEDYSDNYFSIVK